ncbi:phosphoribosylanthranilate isomerase [candidate division KSB1 bacterium]|nr:phosphoribosylanthranilate isomerase [candidate division KSB1 bacterium]
MLRIKICGLTRLKDALLACELGADAVGFIFYSKSPRNISLQAAAIIAEQLPAHVARVGVFVDYSIEEIEIHRRAVGLHALQFHGDYSAREMAQFPSSRLIKVARLRDLSSLEGLTGFQNLAHAFLLDTYEKDKPGGTGKTFDWQLALAAKRFGNIILAGGLNPANMQAAVRFVQPYAIDVNSGVEAAPGIKDLHKLRQLFEQVKEFRRDWQPTNAAAFPVA